MLRAVRGVTWIGSLAVILFIAAAAGPVSGAATGRAYAGRPLTEALQDLQASGLKLIYSSDVVSPGMLVEVEPSGRKPRELLEALLAPHGLEVRKGPGGTLLVVRRAAARAGDPPGAAPDSEGVPSFAERIVVNPPRDPSITGRPDSGRIIDGDEIRRIPGIGDDAQRALALQPGVAAADSSAEISVRGGDPNEVLVRFDGVDLYDPFHLRTLQRFSGIIDTSTLGSAEYFADGFPVEYGDRMSGVLDLSSSIPATPGKTLVGSSVINSRLMSEGTFRQGAGNWLVSARAWYPDAVVRTTDRENEGFAPAYYDLLAKVQVPIGGRTILTANVLAARDEVEFTNPDGTESVNAGSGTRYAWLSVKSLWSPRLYSRTLFSFGRIQGRRAGRIDEESEFSATVNDRRGFNVMELDQDWSHQHSDRFLLKWGVGAKWLDAEYSYAVRTADLSASSGHTAAGGPSSREIILEPAGQQLAAYAGGQFRPVASLQIEAGLRWDRQTYTGGNQVSPRLSLVQGLGRSSRLRAAWGRYCQSQGIHELQVEDGVVEFLPAQRAEQWSVGYEREFTSGLTLRADAYVKKMSSPSPRFENLFDPFELMPEFAPDRVRIAPERAEARGVDLAMTMNHPGPFAWWAAYSRSSIEDRIDGRSVPRSWDQPHAFRLGVNVRGGDAWSAMLVGVYHTGWPTTAVGAVAVEEPGGTTTIEPVLGPRNGDRYPDYNRLDLRASRHFRLGKGRLTVFADITNVYGRDNVCCVEDVTFLPLPDGGIRVDRENGLWLQRVSSLGFAWEFNR